MSTIQVLPNQRARETVIWLEVRGWRVDKMTGEVRPRPSITQAQGELCDTFAHLLAAPWGISRRRPDLDDDGGPDDAA